jgi:hypothetical protein
MGDSLGGCPGGCTGVAVATAGTNRGTAVGGCAVAFVNAACGAAACLWVGAGAGTPATAQMRKLLSHAVYIALSN